MKDFDEMRNIDLEAEPIPSKKPKKEKKGGFLGKFIAVVLGFIFGLLGGVGGLGFFGWYIVARMPIEKSTNKVNGILGTDIDYSQYIDGSYGEKTIANLVGDTVSAIQTISNGEGTLNTLNAISPLVKNLVCGEDGKGGLVETLAGLAIHTDGEALMNRILVKPENAGDIENPQDIYFTDYLKYCVDNASLGDMIQSLGYDTNEVIKTLCYGVEGTDYIYTENGEIQMINGATKLTLKEFLSEDLNEQIKSLPIDSFVTVQFPDDTVMCMLAYGAEYRYEKTLDENGNVVMTKVFYEYSYDADGNFILCDDEGNDVTANIVSGVDNPQNGIVLAHKYMQGEQEITEARFLVYSAAHDRYYAFEDAEYTKPIRFKKNTIGILSDGADALVDKIYVKDLLGVNEKSESVMIALCYGSQGTDWEFDVDGKIQMLGDKKPRTVKDLKKNDLFNSLTLKDVLGIDETSEKVMIALAYGTEGTNWEYDANGKIQMLGDSKPRTIKDLQDGNLINTLALKDVLNVDETSERVMISLAYGTEGTNWEFDANGKIQMLGNSKPRTVQDLQSGEIINQLTLKDLLGEDVEDNMILHSLADTSVENLPAKMNELTFDDIFPDHVYEFETNADGTKTPVYELDENGQQVQKVSAMWNYLFDDPETAVKERPNNYFLLGHDINHPGVDQMIENMQANMQTATLEKLVRDDLVRFEGPNAEQDKDTFLNGEQKQILVNGELKYVREMTIIEMINWALQSSSGI